MTLGPEVRPDRDVLDVAFERMVEDSPVAVEPPSDSPSPYHYSAIASARAANTDSPKPIENDLYAVLAELRDALLKRTAQLHFELADVNRRLTEEAGALRQQLAASPHSPEAERALWEWIAGVISEVEHRTRELLIQQHREVRAAIADGVQRSAREHRLLGIDISVLAQRTEALHEAVTKLTEELTGRPPAARDAPAPQ